MTRDEPAIPFPTRPVLGLSPADVAEIPAERLPAALAALAAATAAVAARLAALPDRNGGQSPANGLVPVDVAARMAGVTREQFLRRVAFKPALVKLGHRTTRVSEKRLRRILEEL